MKKSTFFKLGLFLLILPGFQASSFGQAASVTLKDGAGVPLGVHNSITAAYAAIPATLTQAYTIELNSTYTGANEAYPIVFTAKAGASAANTITLRPAASTVAVSITASVSSNTLIELNDADYIIIDGRPGGVGTTKALTIDNQGTSSSTYGIELINGACNNVFRHFNVGGYNSGSTGGKAIYLSSSTSNPSGNSDNIFEFLRFDGPRTCINSSGSTPNKNRNTKLFGCEFVNVHFAGWWQQNGNGKVTIDSCFFYGNGSSGTSGTGMFGILSDFQTDTIIVTRNHIYNLDNFSFTTDVFGMSFRSFSGPSVLHVSNNMISLMNNNATSDEVYGIALGYVSAANPVEAVIAYNTIRVGGVASGGTTGNVGSSAFFIEQTNAGSTITGRNNILINERTGGNEQHLAVFVLTTNGIISTDYNRFYHAGDFGRIAATVFPSLAAMQIAVAPNEANCDTGVVQFVSNDDLHLAGSSMGDASLAGIQFGGITTDYDGDFRAVPYKGSDESAPLFVCSGAPLSNALSASTDTLCIGDSVQLAVIWNPADSAAYLDVYWQSSTDGVTYSNVAGAMNDSLTDYPASTMYYRYIVKCAASNDSTISGVALVEVIQLPVAGNITSTFNSPGWTFTLPGVQHATAYQWTVQNDPTTYTNSSLNYTFTTGGTYTITVKVSNQCGMDSTSAVVQDFTGITEAAENSFGMYPNPAGTIISIATDPSFVQGNIRIRSLTGALMLEQVLTSGINQLSVETLSNGLYLVEVVSPQGTTVKKLEILR